MKVTRDMKIKEVLALGDQMLDALVFLAPEFERLNYPKLRLAMSGRVTVEQAARIAQIPLAAAIYVLNMAAGADSADVNRELEKFAPPAFEYNDEDPPRKPQEIAGVDDKDARVIFVDVMGEAERHVDPMPRIAKGLVTLKSKSEILLVHHPFDPIPLRDLFAKRGFSSWAEERTPGNWYIYFFRPVAAAAASVRPAVEHAVYLMAASAGSL